MIQLQITLTSKQFGNKGDWYQFDERIQNFGDLDLAKAWLKTEYGTHKKSKMYVDRKDGSPKHTGYIYCMKESDHFEQHWVSFKRIDSIDPVTGE
jgi:hypothetical protein